MPILIISYKSNQYLLLCGADEINIYLGWY